MPGVSHEHINNLYLCVYEVYVYVEHLYEHPLLPFKLIIHNFKESYCDYSQDWIDNRLHAAAQAQIWY